MKLGDKYLIELDSNEFLALLNILSEWAHDNQRLSGPCVPFVHRLYREIHSLPYPHEAAEHYKQLWQDFEKNKVYHAPCPKCGELLDMEPNGEGAFCFSCLTGFPRNFVLTEPDPL